MIMNSWPFVIPSLQMYISFPQLEENPEKRIIVLGLESAGKSTVVAQLTSGARKNNYVKPTEGSSVTCLHHGNVSLNIWDSESAALCNITV
jgi:GTPase SAR1 family protein